MTTIDDKLDQFRIVPDLPGEFHDGIAVRWITAEPPSFDDVMHAADLVAYYATAFADAVIDGAEDWILEYRRADFMRARAKEARLRELENRVGIGATSVRPGALVRRGDWATDHGDIFDTLTESRSE